jgi:photosystem II stability/assembly factor-like uncharacterized protein
MVSAGAAVYISDNGGRTWTVREVPKAVFAVTPAVPALVAATCISKTHCLVVASTEGDYRDTWVLRTTNGGATWSTVVEGIAPGFIADAIACPSRLDCLLGGEFAYFPGDSDSGFILRSTDAGAIWQTSPRSDVSI